MQQQTAQLLICSGQLATGSLCSLAGKRSRTKGSPQAVSRQSRQHCATAVCVCVYTYWDKLVK